MKIRAAAKNSKTLFRMIKQAKLKSFRTAPVYKNGHKVPRNHQQAMDLDRINDNTKWADAEKLEKNQLFEYETFDDHGHKSSSAAPTDTRRSTYTLSTTSSMMADSKLVLLQVDI